VTQILSARVDRALRRALLLAPVLALAAGGLGAYWFRSDAYWGVGDSVEQPIAFRHDLHVRAIGLDCSFCHTGATVARDAGMPSATTCLVCHRQLWRGTRAVQPLYTSVELRQPILWNALHALPGHARFHHGAHAAAGVECATCHGAVAEMIRTTKAAPLSMAWCVDCHAGTAARVAADAPRPRHVQVANARLTDCSTCHY
jgi:hypothetical protein